MCLSRPTRRDLVALLNKLSRGHPEAATVLHQIFLNDPDAYTLFHEIEGLGWDGAHIWEAYKDVCREDLDAFVRLVKRFG
jgi:hypothetical protein